jgi:elongation factor P
MIGVQDLRKGTIFLEDGELWRVVEYAHVKGGRGNATIRVKARNMRKGGTVEKTWPSGSRVNDVRLDHATVQYLYHEGDVYFFMNTETYEQTAINGLQLGDAVKWLADAIMLDLESYEGESITIELPTSVDLEVTDTGPGFAGDTATNATKAATVSTGAHVQVPLFVIVGDKIRVDTRTGEYLTRV